MDDASEPTERSDECEDVEPGPEVTPELFRTWRSPRYSKTNPEQMNNPVWEWLIRSKLPAYAANEQFNGSEAVQDGPCWCFDRFGQSTTSLADGRIVLIAGEHEDFYDSDFYIYNDVVVRHPDGRIDIFGYPKDVFPPTDSHSATLVGNRIVLIGNLGYPEQRRPGTTPVLVLDLATFAISEVAASGSPPGWIHEHETVLSEDGNSILVRSGIVNRGGTDLSFVESIDDWRLHLTDWRWERMTHRQWLRWEIRRADKRPNHLFEIEQALFSRTVRWQKEFEEQMENLRHALGADPNLDIFPTRYRPDVPHAVVPQPEGEYRVFRITVNGVVVRYVEDSHQVQMTVEGDLPSGIVGLLSEDVRDKLASLENTRYELKQITNI